MKRLFVLGIAINDYPLPTHKLRGCTHDRDRFLQFIQEQYSDYFDDISIKILTNTEATRQGVIQAFQHFHQAKSDDTCLFFYAGHGSRVQAPAVFDTNSKLQTIVCYDSRLPEGYDLLDKELVFLIWQATLGRDQAPHFVLIMDCCYARSNTRLDGKQQFRNRSLRTISRAVIPDKILGIEHFYRSDAGKLFPPKAPHILLAAAQGDETAKEMMIDHSTYGGIFTFSLLDVLSIQPIGLSYQQLIDRVVLKVRRRVKKQRPELETYSASDRNHSFLTGIAISSEAESSYLLSYDSKNQWHINIGAIHGISTASDDQPLEFKAKDSNKTITAVKVFSNRIVFGTLDATYNPKQVYELQPTTSTQEALAVVLEDSVTSVASQQLREYNQRFHQEIHFVSSKERAGVQYRLLQNEHNFLLSKQWLGSARIVLKTSLEPIPILFEGLKKINAWHHFLKTRPTTKQQLPTDTVKLELFRKTTDQHKKVTFEEVDYRQTVELIYSPKQSDQRPAIKLKLTNTGLAEYWFSVYYLADDYSITDELLSEQRLAMGHHAWLQNAASKVDDTVIAFFIPEYHSNVVTEYLKIIVSSSPINGHQLNQDGLTSQSLPSSNRTSRRKNKELRDIYWQTFLLTLNFRDTK